MDYRLKIAENDFEALRRLTLASWPKEAGAFALAGVARLPSTTDIIVRRAVAVPHNQFIVQHEYRLEVSAEAVNGLISLCEANGLGAVLCHSHPGKIPYSPSDDYGEQRIFEILHRFIPENAPTASLLFHPGGVTGRVWLRNGMKPVPLSEIVVIGSSIHRIYAGDSTEPVRRVDDAVYDRQVRAFGTDGQALISRATVGIVGVGGTGSPTAEQLVRLGVQDLILVDPDVLEPSNIARVYGTFASQMHRPALRFGDRHLWKAKVVSAHLKKINPKVKARVICENVVQTEVALALRDRDFLFLCTDDHWGRSIVNQIAYQYFIPTINLGARISSDGKSISSAVGVVDILRPETPCLWCRQFLRADRIAAESMPRAMRQPLEAEGYVEGVDTTAPSVVSMTTTVSGLGVTLFLHLVTGFMGHSASIVRLNYDVLEGTIRRGTTLIADKCVCRNVRGFGDLKDLPTVVDMPGLK